MIGLNDSFSASWCASDHLDNNKILALNIEGAHARLPPAPDQDTRSLAFWSVLACWRPLGTLVEAFWVAQSGQTMLYSLHCSALLSGLCSAFCTQDGSNMT